MKAYPGAVQEPLISLWPLFASVCQSSRTTGRGTAWPWKVTRSFHDGYRLCSQQRSDVLPESNKIMQAATFMRFLGFESCGSQWLAWSASLKSCNGAGQLVAELRLMLASMRSALNVWFRMNRSSQKPVLLCSTTKLPLLEITSTHAWRRSPCPQPGQPGKGHKSSEDCLYTTPASTRYIWTTIWHVHCA